MANCRDRGIGPGVRLSWPLGLGLVVGLAGFLLRVGKFVRHVHHISHEGQQLGERLTFRSDSERE